MQVVLNNATVETDNPDLRDRAYIYWRLLSTDPEVGLAKTTCSFFVNIIANIWPMFSVPLSYLKYFVSLSIQYIHGLFFFLYKRTFIYIFSFGKAGMGIGIFYCEDCNRLPLKCSCVCNIRIIGLQ